jgi:predicted DNA-binding transcriptional regulator AlpA
MVDTNDTGSLGDDPIVSGWRGAAVMSGRSVASLKRDVRAGRFPAPIELGPNQLGWRWSWIEGWRATRPRRRYTTAAG